MNNEKNPKFKNIDPDISEISENRGWLPAWWSTMLVVGSILGIVYLILYKDFSQAAQYKQEIADFQKDFPEQAKALTLGKSGNPLRGDIAAIQSGKKTFEATCGACHKPDASGQVGPNLRDAVWLHGNTDAKVFEVVSKGVLDSKQLKQKPPMGPMPSHAHLGDRKIYEVMAWLASINSNLKP